MDFCVPFKNMQCPKVESYSGACRSRVLKIFKCVSTPETILNDGSEHERSPEINPKADFYITIETIPFLELSRTEKHSCAAHVRNMHGDLMKFE